MDGNGVNQAIVGGPLPCRCQSYCTAMQLPPADEMVAVGAAFPITFNANYRTPGELRR